METQTYITIGVSVFLAVLPLMLMSVFAAGKLRGSLEGLTKAVEGISAELRVLDHRQDKADLRVARMEERQRIAEA